jgi:hypothetical protein
VCLGPSTVVRLKGALAHGWVLQLRRRCGYSIRTRSAGAAQAFPAGRHDASARDPAGTRPRYGPRWAPVKLGPEQCRPTHAAARALMASPTSPGGGSSAKTRQTSVSSSQVCATRRAALWSVCVRC